MENYTHGIWMKCWRITDIKDEMQDCDGHAWAGSNFTQRSDGSIALFDYASSRAWPMVKKYGERFSNVLKTTS